MRHPELGEMQVLPLSVPSWRARGWEVVPEPENPPEYVVSAKDARRFEREIKTHAARDDDQDPPRRRRSSKESE